MILPRRSSSKSLRAVGAYWVKPVTWQFELFNLAESKEVLNAIDLTPGPFPIVKERGVNLKNRRCK
jgi:hypothetical protein